MCPGVILKKKKNFLSLPISLFFFLKHSTDSKIERSTELCTLGQRSKKKEVVLQVAPRLESNWEESALLTVPNLVPELHYAA